MHPSRIEFPKSHYDPNPDCKHCHGDGVVIKNNPFSGKPQREPCLCIFVGNTPVFDILKESIDTAFKKTYQDFGLITKDDDNA